MRWRIVTSYRDIVNRSPGWDLMESVILNFSREVTQRGTKKRLRPGKWTILGVGEPGQENKKKYLPAGN